MISELAFEFKGESERDPVKSHSSVPEIKQKPLIHLTAFKGEGVLSAVMNSYLLLSWKSWVTRGKEIKEKIYPKRTYPAGCRWGMNGKAEEWGNHGQRTE